MIQIAYIFPPARHDKTAELSVAHQYRFYNYRLQESPYFILPNGSTIYLSITYSPIFNLKLLDYISFWYDPILTVNTEFFKVKLYCIVVYLFIDLFERKR